MPQRRFSPFILARAKTPAAIAEMNGWRESDLFAAAESALQSLLEAEVGGSWENRVIEALRRADGSPHFVSTQEGEPVALYVLCISSSESPGSLTAAQYAWAESHPEYGVWVLPCVVQHLRADYARCVVESLHLLYSRGKWDAEPIQRQFLPLAQRPPHWLGGAGELKLHRLVRECVHAGTQIFPYVEGLAGNRHLPQGLQVLSSGGAESPLLLVLAESPAGGAVRVRWADFYSSANPHNELELVECHTDGIELMDARGGLYLASCAETAMFGSLFKPGMHLKCALNLLAETYATTPGAPKSFAGMPKKCALITAAVDAVEPVTFCGLRGYCLSVHPNKRMPDLQLNVYVFATLTGGRIPTVGDIVSASGSLHAAVDARVEAAECWADSPRTAQAIAQDEQDAIAESARCSIAPYDTLLAEVAAAFSRSGYRLIEPFEPLYRFGRPEFIFKNEAGNKLMVMIDGIINGSIDFWGYRRRFYPNHYPSHVTQTPQGTGPAELCFLTLRLTSLPDGRFKVEFEQHGTSVPLTLPEVLAQELPISHSELTEQKAAELLADCMNSQKFDAMLPYLREDLSYRSETAALEFFSKNDFLRHLRSRFDMWTKNNDWPQLTFTSASIKHNGVERPCMMAHQNGELISATLFTLSASFIVEMESLSPEQLTEH